MEAPREQAEASAAREAHVGMEAPAGPPRFKCPPDFSASPFSPGPPFSQEALQDPAKELWLIRAPANFSPESLDGLSVPLLGFRTLKAPQPGGAEKIFHVQTTLEHLGGAHLLLPSGHGGRLACSPPFCGSLSVCERYGDPGGNQPLFPVAARPAPRIPEGLRQRFLPFGSNPESAPLPGAVEEPPRKKKKKMKKTHRLGEEEDRPPLFGMPLGETTGAGEAEARGPHEVDGAAPLAVGSQPGSAAVAQNSVLPAEPEDLAPLSKKKKKRKEERERKEETAGEAETGRRHEDGAALPATDPQLSAAADAQNGLLSGETEDLAPLSKKKKKKRKEERERKEETAGEAETGQRHEDGAAPPATDPQLSAAVDGLLSGETEDLAPLSKKKKKKRKEERERKEEMAGEAETGQRHEDGAAPLATDPQLSSAVDGLLSGETEDLAPLSKKKKRKEDREQKEEVGEEADSATRQHEEGGVAGGALGPEAPPNSAAFAHNGLLSGEAEATDPGSKKKKKKKKREEDGERKEETRGEAASPHQADGTAPWAIGSQPDAEPVAQEGPLSGRVEDPGPQRQKKKKKRRDDREVEEETGTEAAHPPEENGTAPWETSSLPSSGLTAQDGGLLSGEAEGPASMSKKKKKKKRKEETGREAEGLLGLSSWPGGDSLPGVEEATQGAHEEAAPPESFSSQGDAAGVLRDFRGELVLAEEEEEQQQPGAGSSSHKAKKKKRKKEKEKPEEAEPGTPLGGGGGGGQEAEPGREELSQKRKKREHRRGQGAEEGPAGLEKEVGNA